MTFSNAAKSCSPAPKPYPTRFCTATSCLNPKTYPPFPPQVLRRYILLTRAGVAVKDGELDAPQHEMSDDVALIQFAVELGRGPYHTLPAAMHLRVIRVLLDDLADGQAMRTELQVREGDK